MPRGTVIGRGWRPRRNLWMLVFPEELEGKQGVGDMKQIGQLLCQTPTFPSCVGTFREQKHSLESACLGLNPAFDFTVRPWIIHFSGSRFFTCKMGPIVPILEKSAVRIKCNYLGTFNVMVRTTKSLSRDMSSCWA